MSAPTQPRWLVYMPIDEVVPADVNPKGHAIEDIMASMRRFGYTEPAFWDERSDKLAAGHGRLEALGMLLAAQEQGLEPPEGIIVGDAGRWEMPVTRGWRSKDDEDLRAYIIASNRLGEKGGWVNELLVSELQALSVSKRGLDGVGYSEAEFNNLLAMSDPGAPSLPRPEGGPSLADRFLVPPFSVFDARQGYWQDRKRSWLTLGIRSEEGRGHNLLGMSDTVLAAQQPNRSVPSSNSGNDPAYYWKKQEAEREAGRELTIEEFEAEFYDPGESYSGGTSIFDPVLCEIAYRWWCPAGGLVLDPFAGGSVRGIVAGMLERRYAGIDLSSGQVEANRQQAADILGPRDRAGLVRWLHGSAADWLAPSADLDGPADLLFSCPPYYDLERYSDDPADLSNAASYEEFMASYSEIIRLAVDRLAPNRFACFVVGDIRGSDGAYRGFVPDTIRAFEAAGAAFYNDIVLVTAVGSLALRAARIFSGGRKVGKAHQNVLVFVKGSPSAAAAACAPVVAADVAEMFGTVVGVDAGADEPAPTPEPPEPAPAGASPAEERVVLMGALEQSVAKAKEARDQAAAPAWAKGLPIEQLREVAALWREHDGDLPLGAFSAAKENTIAGWASDGHLRLWRDQGELVAAAVVTQQSSKRRWGHFSAPEPLIELHAGVRLLRRMACRPGYEQMLAAELVPAIDALEIWQEHPLERWMAQQLAAGWIATKVKASSELVGLWIRGEAEQGYRPPDLWALARLSLNFDPIALMGEVEAAAVAWADHYAVYNKRGSWQAVSLRGYGGDPSFIIKPSEMSKKWKEEHPAELGWQIEDSPLYASLPRIRTLVDSLPGAKHRVRLMRLAPGNGELSRHADITDPDAGTATGRLLRLHFPLRTNEGVIFRGWMPSGEQQAAHMRAGEVWWLDTRKPHTARNDGPTDRIHLVVDVESTPELLALLTDPAVIESAPALWQPGEQRQAEPWTLG
jgi:hypothetical protein